jgi:CheY-like chemotaxis protein
MVVEDEPDIYEVLLAMFEVWGIEGVAFVDGSEAVAWLDDVDADRVNSDLPDVAIIDIRLPDVSGPEVAARIRQSPRLKNIAIALITAYRLSPAEEEEAVTQAEADLMLYKPLPRLDDFRQMLEDARDKRLEMAAAADDEATDETPPAFDADDTEPVNVEAGSEAAEGDDGALSSDSGPFTPPPVSRPEH